MGGWKCKEEKSKKNEKEVLLFKGRECKKDHKMRK
jgi:hypothetical protein